MPKVFVFINVQSGAIELVRNLEPVEGIIEAHSTKGMFDAVAIVEAGSLNTIKEIVAKRVRTLDNVKSTLTLTVTDPPAIQETF